MYAIEKDALFLNRAKKIVVFRLNGHLAQPKAE
jgi:hypothetical protein